MDKILLAVPALRGEQDTIDKWGWTSVSVEQKEMPLLFGYLSENEDRKKELTEKLLFKLTPRK